MPSIEYGGETEGRGPTMQGLWNKAMPAIADYNNGLLGSLDAYWRDDFQDLPTGRYTATQSTTGTFALDDAAGGVALADCNSETVVQGINVQRGGTTGETFLAAAGTTIYFEARVKAADIGTGPEFFLGLHIIDTAIIDTSAMAAADSDWVGFKSLTDNNILLGTTSDNATEATAASIHTLVEDTWVKLGFKVIGTDSVEFYVNGALKSNTITTNLPGGLLVPSLVCQSNGTTDPIVHIDWGQAAAVVSSR